LIAIDPLLRGGLLRQHRLAQQGPDNLVWLQ